MELKVSSDGFLEFKGERFRCALGRSGVQQDKHEGDGVTPVGRFPLRRLHQRADRVSGVTTKLPVRFISPTDGWCDDPTHPDYNRLVRLPFDASHEVMWREDLIYDLVIEIGQNDNPPVPGAGSAIFIHISKPDYAPTEGCVALARDDLMSILPDLSVNTFINILGKN